MSEKVSALIINELIEQIKKDSSFNNISSKLEALLKSERISKDQIHPILEENKDETV
jgi:hypothetical protein